MIVRVVVTGGAGFLGSHVAELLLDRGDGVVAVDNFCTTAENVAHLLDRPGSELLEQDVNVPFEVAGPAGVVMHLASPASSKDYLEMPIATIQGWEPGNVPQARPGPGKARYFLASTSDVYGDPKVHCSQGRDIPIGVFDRRGTLSSPRGTAGTTTIPQGGRPNQICMVAVDLVGESVPLCWWNRARDPRLGRAAQRDDAPPIQS